MKSIYLARRLARMAWAKKAEDIVLLDVRGLSDVSDFLVICTGSVGLHVRAITDFVVDQARELGERVYITEKDSDEWMIADFVTVAFHCFQPAKREYYDLERLWRDGIRMPVDEETGTAMSLKDAQDQAEARRKTADAPGKKRSAQG
ncbi:MAG: ribosome silencing factor [Calditrichaeota bacterium]|nr:ribosome silencing factor [Candidatus Cloacimonadota bacterium]MCA9786157.1 ribosome silencing factor [Candidatus Cloacimonadota bacterium]MCB1048558.1 ribosome silencing factor [Calditrichota bacterium]MCB9472991.1 ribosome silencing factor [Candidatus Delongbacteria bacterium]